MVLLASGDGYANCLQSWRHLRQLVLVAEVKHGRFSWIRMSTPVRDILRLCHYSKRQNTL